MGTQVYVGLGGNIGDTVAVLNHALAEIDKVNGIWELRCSDFYQTSPVGLIEQADYVNAVCGFKTSLDVRELHAALRKIEDALGKVAKPKDHPRVIDLDLLLYGEERVQEDTLQVPHPSWDDRLFVLRPLSDIASEVSVPSLKGMGTFKINILEALGAFSNRHDETVTFLTKPADKKVHP